MDFILQPSYVLALQVNQFQKITSNYITAITQTITLFLDVLLGLEHETFNDNFQVVATFLHILFV